MTSELQSYVKTMGTHPDNSEDLVIPKTYHHRDFTVPDDDYDLDPWLNGPRLTDFYAETHGTRIPNFHARKNAGELLPHTPFYQYKTEWTRSGDYDIYDDLPLWPTRNFVLPVGSHKPPVFTEMTPSKATLEAILDDADFDPYIQDAASAIAMSGHDTLTFLAELHHLRRLFSGTLRKAGTIAANIAGAYRNSSTLSRFRSIHGAISGMWLEQRYGYRILVFDFLEIEKAVARLQRDQRTRFSERRGTTNRSVSEWSVPYTGLGGGSGNFNYIEETEVSTRGSVTADIHVDDFQFNLAITAWELVPYSFVLDWFVHVGRAISALTFLSTVADYSSSGGVLVKVTTTRTTDHTHGANHHGSFYRDSQCVSSVNKRVPSPISTSPLWRLRLDEYKILDLMALLWRFSYSRR